MRGRKGGKRVCRCVFVCSVCVSVRTRDRLFVCVCMSVCVRARACVYVFVFVCIGGAVRPGCRYHPSPCHRPKGCWESGRQLPGSDNRGCILIFRHRMLEKPAPLLPHHPIRKTINPAIREQSTELSPGHRWFASRISSHHPPADSELQHFA